MTPDEVADIFAAFGPVRCRRMFGGLGIYADGVMFALSGFGELYLKTDAELAALLEAEGSRPFAYEASGRIISLRYWSIPDRRLDDPDAVAEIARRALEVARRSAAEKPAAKPRAKPRAGPRASSPAAKRSKKRT